MRQVLIALLVAPCVLSSFDMWGDRGPQPLIYDGEAASEHSFMVHLETGKGKQCGGSIYAKNVILTSAQCVAPKGRKVGVSTVKILVGVSDWTDEDEENRQEAKAKRIITHQEFKGGARSDIALILLEEDLEFNDKVESIGIADSGWNEDYEGTVFVLGWGGTETEKEGTRVLQIIEYSLSDQDECKEYWKTRGRPILPGMFCTGSPEEEQHSWTGDEGGPVFIYKDGSLLQVGLISWGSDKAARKAYDVNTDVVYFKEWAEQHMADTDEYPWIELQGGLSHGVVLLHKDADSKPAAICNRGAGAKELNAICKNLGYNYGVTRSSRDYTGRRPTKGFDKMPEFSATNLECTDGTDNFAGECSFTNYPDDADVPCFDGQQLAVQCANSEWEFDFTHMQTKSGTRGRAMCRLVAQKYGVELDVKSDVSAILVNVKEDGVDIVDKHMKYRRGQSSYISRFKGVEHSCLACVAMIHGAESHFNTYMLEDEDICKMEEAAAQRVLESWIQAYEPESDGKGGKDDGKGGKYGNEN